jgi:hypothetical protein
MPTAYSFWTGDFNENPAEWREKVKTQFTRSPFYAKVVDETLWWRVFGLKRVNRFYRCATAPDFDRLPPLCIPHPGGNAPTLYLPRAQARFMDSIQGSTICLCCQNKTGDSCESPVGGDDQTFTP